MPSRNIRNCSWGYKCEKTWDDLLALESSDHRYCDACDRNVYLCKTADELLASVLLNRCVAFDQNLVEKLKIISANDAFEDVIKSNVLDLAPLEPLSIGEIQVPYYSKSTNSE